MPTWLIIVCLIALVAIVGTVLFFVRGIRLNNAMDREIEADGETVKAWIVDYVPPEGWMWPVVLALLTPDNSLSEQFMRELVEKVERTRSGKAKSSDEKWVKKFTSKPDDDLGGLRTQLPTEYCDGKEVYAHWIGITQYAEKLDEDGLENEWLRIKLIWDKYPFHCVVPPQKRKKTKSRK